MIQYNYTLLWLWMSLGAALVVGLLVWSHARAKGKPGWGIGVGLILLRAAALAVVVFCLMDPQRVEVIRHPPKSKIALVLDTSRSMGITDVPGGRLEAAKRWVQEEFRPRLPKGGTVVNYTFDGALASVARVDNTSATGGVTALSLALENVLEASGNELPNGVVLVSDGVDTVTPMPETVARLYRRKGVPIHTVTVGTTNEMRDVVLENVQVKRAVPNEAPTRIVLNLRSVGFKDERVRVEIRSGQNVEAVREVRLNGGVQTMEMEFTPRQKGFRVYEAQVGSVAGEWLATNNRRAFGLEVTDPKLRVLYMEGTPQQQASPKPEWKYLKDALESDPNIVVTTLYRQLGANGQFLNTVDSDPDTGEKIYPVEHPTRGFPKDLKGLLEYDVVIHSDIRKESFSSEQLKNVARFVENYGGGFLMIGGNSAFGKGGYHRTVLDRIIPVAMEQAQDSQSREFKPRIPASAMSHPIMNLGADRAETQMIWTRKLPSLYGCNRVDRAKPGAVVLAEDPGYRNSHGAGVVLAVQDIGKGRSMAFTSDTTRSWGRDFETLWGETLRPGGLTEDNCDSRYYRQFWVNAIRWLAGGKAGLTNGAVTLELGKGYAAKGETVMARAVVRDAEMREITTGRVRFDMVARGWTNSTLLGRYDAASRAYVGALVPGEVGDYTVTAIAEAGGVKRGEDRQLLTVESTDPELSEPRARPELMARLAADSGGLVFGTGPRNMKELGTIFANVPPERAERRLHSLWDKPGWLLLILGLLAMEWILRRVKGLA